MGSIALMHTPTGLNIAFAAGREFEGGISLTPIAIPNPTNTDNNASFWHVEGGISQNFFGPGNTSVYGEYGSYDDGSLAVAPTAAVLGVDPTTTVWGLGVVQNFDAAATELYIAYRHWENDTDTGTGADATSDGEVSQVLAGMRIKF
jgi:hypothetical protein